MTSLPLIVHGSGSGNFSLWICTFVICQVEVIIFFIVPTSWDAVSLQETKDMGTLQKFRCLSHLWSLVLSMGVNKEVVSCFPSISVIPLKLSLC